MDLKGRKALVTGASRGIGRAVAIALARAGADVAINYSSDTGGAAETSRMIRELGAGSLDFQVDVSDYEAVGRMFESIAGQWGRLDILINNAGVNSDGLTVRMKPEHWDKVLRVNLTGAFNCIRHASRMMIKQRYGRIVNISSVVGIIGNPGQANYAAAKAGLIGLTRTLARELGQAGITVNAIAPGFIETSMTQDLPDGAKNTLLSRVALGRPGKPEDVAASALFLVSGGGDYVTGHVLVVDGGLTS